MNRYTTDPNDPRLKHGVNDMPSAQAPVYLILSEEECSSGFVRPIRHNYLHIGPKPEFPLRDLSPEEREKYHQFNFAKFEEYPADRSPVTGRFWGQRELDGKTCGGETYLSDELAKTYARDPSFYGSTYCCGCSMHRPVAEFVWPDGTVVGS